MPIVWKLHKKRRFHALPEASAPPSFHHSVSEKKALPRSGTIRHKQARTGAPPVGPGTLYWRRLARTSGQKRPSNPTPYDLPPSPDLDDLLDSPLPRVPHRAHFLDLDEIFSQFSTPEAREAEGAAEWFRFQAQLAARNLVADLLIWVKRDFDSAQHAARWWREDLQAWVDGFEEWEMGGEMYCEAVRIAGDLPLLVQGEGNQGMLCPNDIDPTERRVKYGDPDLSDGDEEGLVETPPFTLYSGSGSD